MLMSDGVADADDRPQQLHAVSLTHFYIDMALAKWRKQREGSKGRVVTPTLTEGPVPPTFVRYYRVTHII